MQKLTLEQKKEQIQQLQLKDLQFFLYDPHFYWKYILLRFDLFLKRPKAIVKNHKKIIVDSGVIKYLNIKTNPQLEYPYLEKFEKNVKKYGSEKCKFVIPDYPLSILPEKYQNRVKEIFIKRNQSNINKFCNLKNTILSIQYEFKNIKSFKQNFNKYYNLSDHLAIGNLKECRDKRFFYKMVRFIQRQNIDNKPIHFFGIGKPLLKILFLFDTLDFDVSFDSMKWRIKNDKEKNTIMYSNNYQAIDFFLEYMQELIKIQNTIRNRITLDQFTKK